MKLFLLIVIAFAVIASDVCAYKILGLFPFMAKSHFIVGNSLMKGLVKAGHEVSLQS
jgi:glucuronosyltransferase